MILVATTNTVIARLSGVPAAQWPIQVSYGDLTATTLTGGQQLSVTNSTTNVTILAAPAASTQRQIKNINVYNNGATALTLTIVIDVSGVETIVWKDTVPVGKSLIWTDEAGWAISTNTSYTASGGGGGAVTDVFGRTGNVVAVAGDYSANLITNVPAGSISSTDVQGAINELAGDISALVTGVSSVFGRSGAVVAVANDYSAALVQNTPAGNIAAVTVQAAVDELDAEKVAKAGDTMTGNLIVNKSGAAVPAAFGADELRIVGSTGADALIWSDSFAGPPVFGGRRAQGVPGAPTAAVTGNTLVAMRGYGYGSTGYATSHRGSVTVLASETWTDAAQGTRLVFGTTSNTTIGHSARFAVENDGSFVYQGGSLTGISTINAVDYFDNNVNINLIYASLALPNVFTAVQTIDLNAAALPAPPANTTLHLGAADAAINRITIDGYGAGAVPVVTGRRANGTAAVPTAAVNGDSLLTINGFGYGATGYSAARASVGFVTTENWTDTAQGTRVQIVTTANGTILNAAKWIFENDGSLFYAAGAATGNGTVNALNYFVAGANINTIYSAIAGHAANSVLGRAGNTVGPIADIAATTSGHVLTYNGTDVVWAAPAATGVNTQDEGIAVLSPSTTINFVGAGVTATNGGGGVTTVTIPGGGGGSGVDVEDEGISVLAPATTLNFIGAGVTVTNGGGGQADITIPGGGAATFDYGMHFALRSAIFF